MLNHCTFFLVFKIEGSDICWENDLQEFTHSLIDAFTHGWIVTLVPTGI